MNLYACLSQISIDEPIGTNADGGMLIQSINRKIETWPELVKLWPYLATFAEEVGVPLFRARGWLNRMSVPSRYFPQIVEAAKAYGITCTTEDLAALAWSKEEKN